MSSGDTIHRFVRVIVEPRLSKPICSVWNWRLVLLCCRPIHWLVPKQRADSIRLGHLVKNDVGSWYGWAIDMFQSSMEPRFVCAISSKMRLGLDVNGGDHSIFWFSTGKLTNDMFATIYCISHNVFGHNRLSCIWLDYDWLGCNCLDYVFLTCWWLTWLWLTWWWLTR